MEHGVRVCNTVCKFAFCSFWLVSLFIDFIGRAANKASQSSCSLIVRVGCFVLDGC